MALMRRDRQRLPSDASGMKLAGSSMPGAAKRPPAPSTPAAPGAQRSMVPTGANALGRASRQMGPVTSAPANMAQAAMPTQAESLRLAGEALMSMGGPPPSQLVDAGVQPGTGVLAGPASIANGLFDAGAAYNNGTNADFGPPSAGVANRPVDIADILTGGGLGYADGFGPAATSDPSLDDLANSTQGGLREEIARLLAEGGRDVAGEQEAMAAQMEAQRQQQMVDARARMGAMGMGASGAQVALEGDMNSQAAIAQALAGSEIESSARAEDLARLGALSNAFGGLEGLSQDQKMMELAFQLLGEEDQSATAGEESPGFLEDAQQAAEGLVPWGGQEAGPGFMSASGTITPDEGGSAAEQLAAWLASIGRYG